MRDLNRPGISPPALINRINAHPVTASQIGNIFAAKFTGGITPGLLPSR